ncbi:MAG: 2-succinyl-6-hydroxy-2,4-cyclohexadiene-1-carboxylate synthase [Timaviella obliquedivisa GSE-PSE-MK23-08B]|jgi:2-succinyl-6-hydroxy-2,4-cyclohexadiene-1-carboxylate synthase|nr:2-succinyl-6-hydroxy-2,4-cyclohexadiene-1-carboxylate synthase [Timaviella obliquedivisa GSE-PSE-MK23-08B]
MEGIISFENYQFGYSLKGRSDRPAILFLHGFMGDRHDFAPITSCLIEHYQCLAIDLPGHGKTQVIEEAECGMALTAQAIIGALDQLQIPQCFLVGYSMGGRLALYLTLHFPERFIGTMLESASPGLKTEEERNQRSQRDWQLATELETTNFSEFLTNWYKQPLFASMTRLTDSSKSAPRFEQMLARRQQNQPHELAKSLRSLGTGSQPSLWAKLAHNQVPLLLLVGELDQKFVQTNQEMQMLCSSAQLQIMAECGHNVHFENVLGFGERLREFLLAIV